MSDTLTIARLGAKGDGIAETPGGPVYVPFSLAGEIVEATREGARARIDAILSASPERREAPCPHFGICGGCDLQHASDAVYRAFKRDVVVEAFRRQGIEAEVGELVPCAPQTRRRAVFSAVRAGNRVLFGFNAALTHRIVPIEVCLVVVPAIAERLAVFRELAGLAIDRKRPLRMTVMASASGVDVALEDTAKLNEPLRQKIVRLAIEANLARVSLGQEVLIETRPPLVDVGGLAVQPPPGAFLQAVASAEAAMAAKVLSHLDSCRSVADLFSGFGTFSLRLARHSAVHAVESDAAALAALDRTVRTERGLRPVTSERRDLYRRPLTAKELKRFDGIVFDPPRAGAEAQSRELAASAVPRIAAVSCNPATLARDARLLIDGGYSLVSVVPIDQFLWSHHVEAVALFERS